VLIVKQPGMVPAAELDDSGQALRVRGDVIGRLRIAEAGTGSIAIEDGSYNF
jgi:hypothetical protein